MGPLRAIPPRGPHPVGREAIMGIDATTPAPGPPEGTPPSAAPPPPAAPPGRTSLLKRCCRALGAGGRRLAARPRRLALAVVLLALFGVVVWLVGTRVWAMSHLRSARACLERYHSREAAEHLRRCMEVWPDDPEVRLLAARAARRLGEFETADKLLSRRPASAPLADAFDLEQVMLRAARGETGQVGALCRALIDRNHPATPLLLEALAQGSLEAGRTRDAGRYLDEWLKREPNNPQAHLLRGNLQNILRNFSAAAEEFGRALELDPELDAARL